MSNLLSLSNKYLHPYEAAYNMVRNSPFFKEDDWRAHAARGNLQQYLLLLEEADSKLDFDKFDKPYMFDRLNSDERFAVVANELWSDRTDLKPREEIYLDETTGKEETRKFDMSDYDYTNYLLKNKLELEKLKIIKEKEQEAKNSITGFKKFIYNVGGALAEPAHGVLDMLNDMMSLVEGIADASVAVFKGENAGTAFREAFNANPWGSADWRLFDNIGFTDAILEFERKYTEFRDIDGNYTTLGKYIGGVGYSLGKAVPSILLNALVGGIAGKGTAAAERMAKAATAIYYTGMGAGEFKELASNPNLASIPTIKLMTNAVVKTTLEYMVQKGVSEAFGPTSMDALIFGEIPKSAGKITALGAIKRIAKDFIAEGTEELIQQWSSYVVDSFMSIKDKEFGELSQWNGQVMFDAFILGGLSTIGHNVLSVISSGVSDLANIKKLSGDPKLNFLANWEFKNTMSELVTHYNSVLKNKSLTDIQRSELIGQMHVTLRTIASVYGEIGEARFAEATKFLEEMRKNDKQIYMTDDQAKKAAEAIYKSVGDMKVDKLAENIVDKLLDAKMTEIHSVIDGTEDDEALPEDVRGQAVATIRAILTPGSNIKQVALTKDGKNIVVTDKTIFAPIEYFKNTPTDAVLKHIAEQTLVDNVNKATELKSILIDIKRTFEYVSGRTDVDADEVIYNLFFNSTFQRILLSTANADMLQLISSLQTLEAKATKDVVKDDVYKKRFSDMLRILKIELFQYLVNQQAPNLADVKGILDQKQLDKVQELRYSKDLANRIINNDKNNPITKEDIEVMNKRINAMPTTEQRKQEIREGLFSDNRDARQSAFVGMERFYKDVYNSPYNGRTYLQNDTIPNVEFNEFIKSYNLTVEDLHKLSAEELQAYRLKFEQKSQGRYTFSLGNNTAKVYELSVNPTRGYSYSFAMSRDDILLGKDMEGRTFTTVRQGGDKLLGKLLSKDLDAVSKSYIDIRNVIYNPELLNDAVKQEIVKLYGALNQETAFLYLRQRFLKDTGTTTIVMMANGTVQFADIRPMLEVLSNREVDIKSITGDTNIDKLVLEKYLIGRLKDITVKLGTKSEYNAAENTITIDENFAQSPAYFRFALLHEFQHAVQFESRMNGGLAADFMSKLSANKRAELVKEVRAHKPSLFDGVRLNSREAVEIAQEFIYDTSGESGAYGVDTDAGIVDFYPTVVDRSVGRTVLTTPWGTKYSLNDITQDVDEANAANNQSMYIDKENYKRYFRQADVIAKNSLVPYSKTKVRKGFILPNGFLGFMKNPKNIHPEFIDFIASSSDNSLAAGSYMNDAVQITNDVQGSETVVDEHGIAKQTRTVQILGHVGGNYTVRMLSYMSPVQREALEQFIDKALTDGHAVILGDAHGHTLTDSRHLNTPWKPNSYDLLKQYGKDFARSRAQIGVVGYNINYNTQLFYGDSYLRAMRAVDEMYDKKYENGKNFDLLIPLDGSVKFGEEGLIWRSEAIINKRINSPGMASQVIETSIRGDVIDDTLSIRLPFYVASEQMFSLADLVMKMSNDGKNIEMRTMEGRTWSYRPDRTGVSTEYVTAMIQRMVTLVNMASIESDKLGYKQIRDEMSMAQPSDRKSRRFVSQKDAADTNLKYFVQKNKQIQLDPAAQDFIVQADSSLIDREIWNMIGGDEKGTLTKQKVFNYLRKANAIDPYTFKLIKDSFFRDSPIETFDQLEYLIHQDIASYYALRGVLRELKAEELLYQQISHLQFKELVDKLSRLPEIKAKFDKIVARYERFKGEPLDIDFANMRIAFMKYFDGSIHSAGYVAAIGKMLAITGWNIPGKFKTTSLGTEIKGDLTYEDVLEDTSIQDALEEILSKDGRTDKENAVLTYMYEQMCIKIQEGNLKPTQGQLMTKMKTYRDKVEALSDNDLDQWFAKTQIATIANANLTDEALESNKPIVRPRVNIAAQIQRFPTTIRNNLTKNDKKRFLSVNSDLFNDDLTLKKELYVGKDRETLLNLEDKLRAITKEVKNGVYRSKLSVDIMKQLKRTRKKWELEHDKRLGRVAKGTKVVTIGDHEFSINSTAEIPAELKAILETTFEKFVKTDVKYLTAEGEKHMQMNLQSFIDQNAQRLSALTTQEVSDIITYYQNSFLTGNVTESSYKKYNAFKLYVLGFIYDRAKAGVWQLSATQFADLTAIIDTTASNAGTELAAFRSILTLINPEKVIMQSAARASGLEFKEKDILQVVDAVRRKDMDGLKAAARNLYTEGLKLYKGNKKTFFDKAWKFQRMMMLSSPGTAIRNVTSNVLLTLGNEVGGVIGKLFTKKHLKGQYVITGTVVPTKVTSFIKTNFLDNGIMELVSDGMNKYDPRKIGTKSSGAVISDMIVKSVTSKIFHQNQFDTDTLNKTAKFIYSMLSDDPWITRKTISYFGKMLTENNEPLWLSSKVYETFAEAYTLAAWDYMHKPNVFNKMETAIKQRTSPAVYYMYKQILPFAGASWNWFLEGLNYTPVGLVKAIVDFAKLENVITKMDKDRQYGEQTPTSRFAEYLIKRNIGKGVIGSVALGIGLLLGGTGVARVDEEDDKIKLFVGDLAVDISGLFGTQAIILGIAMTNPREGNWEKYIYDVAETLFLDSTFQDLFNTFRYSNTLGEWLINQPGDMLARYVPNALKAFTSLLYNHKISYSPGIVNGFERFLVNSLPGFAYAMPKKVDIYTGEVQTKYSIPFLFQFVNKISPVDFAHYKVTELEKQAIFLGVNKANLTGKYSDIGELSNKEVEQLNQQYGKLNNKTLQDFYNGKNKFKVQMSNGTYNELFYAQMTKEQRQLVTNRIMTENAKYAKIIVWTEKGGKYYATSSEFEELRKMGITKNVYKENKVKEQVGFK